MVLTAEFDHADPAISDSLLDWGARFRDAEGLGWSDAHGGFWIAARHKDILAVLRDTETFICAKRITLPPQKSPVPVIPLESDEPDHSFYRAVFMPLLMPKAVGSYEAKVRQIVTDALDPIVARGEGDAVLDFAARIPTRAMAAIFGLTDEDAYQTDAHFSALVAAAGSADVAAQDRAVDAYKDFLLGKLEDRRRDPRENDLVTALLRYEANGRRYNEDELLGLMWSAAGGAIDTTKHAIGHAMNLLGRDKGLRARLIEQPRLIPFFVEESLRLNPSAFFVSRYIARDTVLSGTPLQAGQRILLGYGFGNRDAAAFADPDDVVLDRPPNQMLTFGQGIHQCAGMHLGRFETKIAVEEVLSRIPRFELTDTAARPQILGGMMWAHDSLPIKAAA